MSETTSIMHFYRAGDTLFYSVTGADGVLREGYRFDRNAKVFVSDIADTTRRLYISPEDVDQITRQEFHALVKSQGGEGAP